MLINKKISFLKYYKEESLEVASLQENIKVIYRLRNNFYDMWIKSSYNFGEEQDFYYLEKDFTYIIISEPTDVGYEIDNGQNDKDYEFIINNKQISPYQGNTLNIEIFKNIKTIYKVSENGENYLIWNVDSYKLGEEQDFNSLLNNELYLIVSNSSSYVFWPPLNFNKSQSIDSNNVNWGLLEHIR